VVAVVGGGDGVLRVESIHGDIQKVTHLELEFEKKIKKTLPVDTLFLAIGSKPKLIFFAINSS